LARAESELSSERARRNRAISFNTSKREELRRDLTGWDISISNLTTQLTKESEQHQQNLAQIREACRLIKERCMVPRSRAEDQRYSAETSRLNAELSNQHQKRSKLQTQLAALTASDSESDAPISQRVSTAEVKLNERRQQFRTAVDRSQIHRLAASWYGVNAVDLTPEQFAAARFVFSTFSAVAIALVGSVAALVHYSHNRSPRTVPVFGQAVIYLLRARRAYYARKRKSLVREIPGPERVVYRDGASPPIVVEKEVSRFIDRIVLIPRFGIRFPVYINRLLNAGPSTDSAKDNTDVFSNVTALSKRAM
jgi:hypothetical protein